MGAQVVHVLDDEQPFNRTADLGQARHHSVREDVLVGPGVAVHVGFVAPDGMQKEDASVLQVVMDRFHEGTVVLEADVLEHAHGDYLVECTPNIAIITFQELHRKVPAELAGIVQLLPGDVHRGYAAAEALGDVLGKPAPTTADIKNAVLRTEVHLAADEVHLRQLGLMKVLRTAEKGTAVLVVGIKKRQEQVVTGVVVPVRDDPGAPPALEVKQPGRDGGPEYPEVSSDPGVEPGSQYPEKKLIQSCAIPPTLHVGLPEAKVFLTEHPRVQPVVPDLDIPRVRAVNGHTRHGEQFLYDLTLFRHDRFSTFTADKQAVTS